MYKLFLNAHCDSGTGRTTGAQNAWAANSAASMIDAASMKGIDARYIADEKAIIFDRHEKRGLFIAVKGLPKILGSKAVYVDGPFACDE